MIYEIDVRVVVDIGTNKTAYLALVYLVGIALMSGNIVVLRAVQSDRKKFHRENLSLKTFLGKKMCFEASIRPFYLW